MAKTNVANQRPQANGAVFRLDLPLAPQTESRGPSSLDLFINRTQARALDRLVVTLDKMGVRTTRDDGSPGGERVTTKVSALRWLLDQVAAVQ